MVQMFYYVLRFVHQNFFLVPELQGLPQFISKSKCQYAYEQLKKPVVVEDTSLEFNAWNGLPGPYM